MPIELKMPALSPTMEEGTLAKWLKGEGDSVAAGDILAEIETDKATMEFEAVDEGTVARILVEEGTDEVKVGTVIAILAEEGEDVKEAAQAAPKGGEKPEGKSAGGEEEQKADRREEERREEERRKADKGGDESGVERRQAERREGQRRSGDAKAPPAPKDAEGKRIKASPLARRIAAQKGIELAAIEGSGPKGRIVKADVEAAKAAPAAKGAPAPAEAPSYPVPEIPHEAEKLSNMRKTIARRLTEAKQTVPHIYLTVDIRLDALLKLRSELNAALEAREIKLSVNDMLIKALAASLIDVPECNVQFTGDQLIRFQRADISVAVSIPGGLITPIVAGAEAKSLSAIATEMKDLAGRAREGKLKPEEYQGGTASLSNMGMYGITQFDAVINPPQGMIMAVGAGEKRPYVIDDSLQIATIMSATGSFDHRAIDGADGARQMQRFKELVENPLGMLA